MHLTSKEKPVAYFSAAYIVLFLLYSIIVKNYEFVYYMAVLVLFFILIFAYQRSLNFSPGLLWALSSWGLLHLAGGNIPINGSVLYNLWLLPFLKYDMAVHAYGFAAATFVGFALLEKQLKKPVKSPKLIIFLCFIMGMGFGALNELVEFLAVLFIPNTNVGGYMNTGFDLLFNFLGSIIAAILLFFTRV